MVSYEKNLYYNPENLGYRVVATVDLDDEPWQFDILVVWERESDGTLWYATDSGCSCPVPFEETSEEDLSPFVYREVAKVARSGYGYKRNEASIEDGLRGLRYLKPRD